MGSSGQILSRFLLHEATRSVSTPPRMQCYSIARLFPLPQHSICQYPFIHLCREIGITRVKCPEKEHRGLTRAGGWDGGSSTNCMLSPSIQFTGTHSYAWLKKGRMRVKCLAKEHNTVPGQVSIPDSLIQSPGH